MHDGLNHPAVVARDLSVAFGSRSAVEDVSFCLAPGELVALVGPNGAGKTTLLRALLGLVPRSGDVVLHGSTPRPAAYVSQRAGLDPAFPITVVEVVRTGCRALRPTWHVAGRGGRRRERQAASRALAQVGLDGSEDRTFGELSGGQAQRVLIARALVAEPDVLLLDEPFAGLDVTATRDVCDLLTGVAARGTTVLVTVHDLQLVRDRFARCLAINRRLVGDGHPADVLAPHGLERLLVA